ncbi:MAG: diacylglycerol kinase family lipid kinase [Chlorobiales bacterium]|jgi:diacylglycerol kinase (ATP)|nr:diacylglycerol kinase family lipid kinase [Chlorobiales bacterium]
MSQPAFLQRNGDSCSSRQTDDTILQDALRGMESGRHRTGANNKHLRYWFILNPAADKGRARSRVAWLQQSIRKWGIDTVVQLTTQPKDASRFAEDVKGNIDVVVACGGDGTLNEVVQALVHSDKILGCVPIGSANDFYKNIASPDLPTDTLSHIFKSGVEPVDVGQVTITDSSGKNFRYFINSFGLGFSGRIAQVASQLTWLKGDLIYLYALLKVTRSYKPVHMRLTLHTPDGIVSLDEKVFMVSIGNGRYEAGKFMIAPDASIRDGWLDVCVLKAISRREVPRWILKYIKGTQITESKVVYAKVKKLEIDLSVPEMLHLDGEVIENVSGKITVEVCPSSLKVLSGNIVS